MPSPRKWASVVWVCGIAGIAMLWMNAPKAAPESKKETDSPDLAHAWRRLGMLSENGTIAPDAWSIARNQMQALAAKSVTRGVEGWREAGPFNVAGRTRSLLIDPRNTQVMYSGSVGGGIWKTTNGGASWFSVSDRLPNMSVGCMVFQPGNPDIIYAGTGEGFFNSDALGGSGILKSMDAGQTWTIMPSTVNFVAITRIAISPTDGNRMLVTTATGGVNLSTNGGATWSLPQAAQRGHQVLFHPTDGQKALLTVKDYDFATSQWFSQAYYSLNAGATWTPVTGLKTIGYEMRIELAYAPNSPTTVYASTANGGKVYRSTNGGQSFVLRGSIGLSETQLWYDNAVWVDPINANRLVFGGVYPYRSIDGGATWSRIGEGYLITEQPHPDVHAIVADPGFNGTTNLAVYLCTDGGVFKTTNILTASTTSGWTRVSRDVRTAQFYGAVGDGPTGRLIGGTQDNGTLQMNNSPTGSWAWGGDGGWCAMDPANPDIFYGEYVFLQIFRTTNGGPNAVEIHNGIGDVANANANFIAPFILDPNNSSRMLAGGSSLWRSNNVKSSPPSWASIKAGIGSHISAIAVAPGNSNIIWVGHNDGRIFRTTTGTAVTPTWIAVDNNAATNPLPNRFVHRILIDPANASKAYIALGGFSPNNLWLTTTAGSSFVQRTGTGANVLPSAPVRALARHPNDANLLYAGTEVGLCHSSDGGLNWSAPSTGPVNVSVDELRYLNNSTKLLAATHGRGLWILGPVNVTSLQGPATIAAGGSTSITMTLDGIAGNGGVDVALTSSSSFLTLPASVSVPGGSQGTAFSVTAGSPAADTPVTITATLNGSSRTLNLTVKKPANPVLASLSVTPTSVPGGSSIIPIVTVKLAAVAPTGGTVVALSSSLPTACSVPPTATVPGGQISVIVNASTSSVASVQSVTITASLAAVTKTAALSITPPRPLTLVLSPRTATGGSATTVSAILRMTAPAPLGGVSVNLSSSVPAAATIQSSVMIAEGQTMATIPVTHVAVNVDKLVNIRATANGVFREDVLTVKTSEVSTVSLSPAALSGGSATVVTATVKLNAPAAAPGAPVSLAPDPAIVTLSAASVTVPTGALTATFQITAPTTVVTDTPVAIKATRGVEKSATLTVTPPLVSTLVLTPTSVIGGSATIVQGTVTLNVAAPAGGVVVTLTSADTSAATVPVNITVPAGATTQTFTITHFAVATQKLVAIKAATGATSRIRNLTVNP